MDNSYKNKNTKPSTTTAIFRGKRNIKANEKISEKKNTKTNATINAFNRKLNKQ